MATFDVFGAGVVTLTPGTTRVFVEIITYPPGRSVGAAEPANYYGVGLLRFGIGGYFGVATPVDGSFIYRDVPSGATQLGYSVAPSGVVRIEEEAEPPPPPASVSFFDNTRVPASTFVNSGTGCASDAFHCVLTGCSIIGMRYLRPADDAGPDTIDFGIWDDTSGLLVYDGHGHTVVAGWNQWSIPTITVPDDRTYWLQYVQITGSTYVYETAIWDSITATGIVGTDDDAADCTDLTLPSGVTGHSWWGLDVVVLIP